jgi:hypothetical protein
VELRDRRLEIARRWTERLARGPAQELADAADQLECGRAWLEQLGDRLDDERRALERRRRGEPGQGNVGARAVGLLLRVAFREREVGLLKPGAEAPQAFAGLLGRLVPDVAAGSGIIRRQDVLHLVELVLDLEHARLEALLAVGLADGQVRHLGFQLAAAARRVLRGALRRLGQDVAEVVARRAEVWLGHVASRPDRRECGAGALDTGRARSDPGAEDAGRAWLDLALEFRGRLAGKVLEPRGWRDALRQVDRQMAGVAGRGRGGLAAERRRVVPAARDRAWWRSGALGRDRRCAELLENRFEGVSDRGADALPQRFLRDRGGGLRRLCKRRERRGRALRDRLRLLVQLGHLRVGLLVERILARRARVHQGLVLLGD